MEEGVSHVDHQQHEAAGRWSTREAVYEQHHPHSSGQHIPSGAHPGQVYGLPPQQHYYHPGPHAQQHPSHHYAPQPYEQRYSAATIPPLPPLPSSSTTSGSQPQTNYYYSAPHGPPHQPPLPPAPQGYDWAGAALPPIRLHPPMAYGHPSAPLQAPGLTHMTHSTITPYPTAAPPRRSPSVSSSSNRDAEGSTYSGSAQGARSWAHYDAGLPSEVKAEEQEQFDSSVQALQSLAHASTAAAELLPPFDLDRSDDEEGSKPRALSSEAKGKGRAKGKTYASSDSEGGDEIGEDGQRIKKRKRRRKASEQPRDAANRKFMCETCKKLFARPSALATHERSHSKEKPHICPFPTCRRPFAVPSNLRRHQRVYVRSSSQSKASVLTADLPSDFSRSIAIVPTEQNHQDPTLASSTTSGTVTTPTSTSGTPSGSPTSVSAPLELSSLPLPLPPFKDIPPLAVGEAPLPTHRDSIAAQSCPGGEGAGGGTRGLAWSE